MDQPVTPMTSTVRRYRLNPLRILLCGVLMTALVAFCLYLYHTSFAFLQERLLEDESKTLAWFAKQLSFSLPFIILCLFPYMVYHKHDRRDGVARMEMLWEMILVALLVYGVLLPYLSRISEALYTNAIAAGESFPRNEGDVEETLIMGFHEWFIRLSLPLLVLSLFHATRARRERRFPETEEQEPLLTVEEYDALKAQKALQELRAKTDGETLTVTDFSAPDAPAADASAATPPKEESTNA